MRQQFGSYTVVGDPDYAVIMYNHRADRVFEGPGAFERAEAAVRARITDCRGCKDDPLRVPGAVLVAKSGSSFFPDHVRRCTRCYLYDDDLAAMNAVRATHDEKPLASDPFALVGVAADKEQRFLVGYVASITLCTGGDLIPDAETLREVLAENLVGHMGAAMGLRDLGIPAEKLAAELHLLACEAAADEEV